MTKTNGTASPGGNDPAVAAGFTDDGYIIDQKRFAGYRYRTMRSDINGCGWIAAYNLLHALGSDIGFDRVRQEMDAMIRLRVPGPTPIRVLRRYLGKSTDVEVVPGRKRAVQAAEACRAGILRYWEGREPHFVAFLNRGDGTFRFLNVTPGRKQIICPMSRFLEERCRHGSVYTIPAGLLRQQE